MHPDNQEILINPPPFYPRGKQITLKPSCSHKAPSVTTSSFQAGLHVKNPALQVGKGGNHQKATEALVRMRVLEEQLCAYASCGVPVLTLHLPDFQDIVDQLHDYLLECIQMAMAPEEGSAPVQTPGMAV
jgi:hypothetical protein